MIEAEFAALTVAIVARARRRRVTSIAREGQSSARASGPLGRTTPSVRSMRTVSAGTTQRTTPNAPPPGPEMKRDGRSA